ncbi:MAG: hypothetical protein A2268_14470 [Candidatus Raymondbacteria bacterium RifOxyA12_full_50_37]|uniref:PIN domain-containing protein n=1 Tax=Candidatus Raymondbacteria bacterium RIFOXYD12_FULL_49_13 TaxID=1817890 RepID=A0A1F7F2N6_UNCRA|nr:MAG: hypothetical protein A2268_14470 [Candidatus Raymondbacteria bacterium RifOxyA12_full_50_37]OGJ88624.1 MAG: hypothetical protein A2248_20405 [Candidatus Raymondbacteria bacterium RIFOXYA2_FULL_49_16]OGK00797.1 MAG: hypothetical protein A2519_07660 [Candidatus Raymondbacteria bacterium RIFOXYD12_FULL_49_13]OGK02900.1 MAG: hypothetical protein A2487_17905 [Candidatus Raymondbacteria bacterium RifOxyC12_full_50_8]OGK02950.1 MAG: hypothetical protein A2350_20075 [Candidatus Raymondbacteria 
MIIIDTSAWIEYFNNGIPRVVQKVDEALEGEIVGIGDLVYCEVLQGIRYRHEWDQISTLFNSLTRCPMVGFPIAEKASRNYTILRSKGITIRKTIDVIIGTYCVENGLGLIHNDRDFDIMSPYLGLKII